MKVLWSGCIAVLLSVSVDGKAENTQDFSDFDWSEETTVKTTKDQNLKKLMVDFLTEEDKKHLGIWDCNPLGKPDYRAVLVVNKRVIKFYPSAGKVVAFRGESKESFTDKPWVISSLATGWISYPANSKVGSLSLEFDYDSNVLSYTYAGLMNGPSNYQCIQRVAQYEES